uniref:Palmitoyltransferase n=2 Tax=Rhabditophanes sp. KR3021 TaxID=114890 RepID=A0AC35TSX0_9BILA
MPEAITRHYSQSAPMPSYVTVDRLEEQTKKILQEIDPTDVLEDDRYYYQAHGLRTTDEPTKYCMACRCVAPRRAHHCPLCEICIIRKDHHCFFTGGCIGLANQRYFMMFCLWAGIGTLYGLWFSTRYMQMFVSEPWPFGFFKWLSPIAIGRWLGGYESMTTVLMSVFYTLNFGALFGTFGFFFAECFYTCVGYTMFDYHTGRLRDHIESDGENEKLLLKNELVNEKLNEIKGMRGCLSSLSKQFREEVGGMKNMHAKILELAEGDESIKNQYQKTVACHAKVQNLRQQYVMTEVDFEVNELLGSRSYERLAKKITSYQSSWSLGNVEELSNKLVKKFVENCNCLLDAVGFPYDEDVLSESFQKYHSDISANLGFVHQLSNKYECEDKPLVLRILFKKFQLRFDKHFNSESITNDSNKPELVYTALNNWYISNSNIIFKLLSPFYDDDTVDVDYEFRTYLIELAQWKMKKWLYKEEIIEDPIKLGFLLDAAFNATTEILPLFNENEYAKEKVLSIFYEEKEVLEKWLCMDKKALTVEMNKCIEALRENEQDNAKKPPIVSELAENLSVAIYVLNNTFKYYQLIPKISIRFRFIQQQFMQINKFKNLLIEEGLNEDSISSAKTITVTSILSQLYRYLKEKEKYIVGEFDNQLEFTVNTESSEKLNFGVFLINFKRDLTNLIHSQCDGIIAKQESKLNDYYNEKWYSWKNPQRIVEPNFQMTVTESFWPYVCSLKEIYQNLDLLVPFYWVDEACDYLNHRLFQNLIGSFILNKSFNEFGAKQILFDVQNGLVSMMTTIFLQNNLYRSTPEQVLNNCDYIQLINMLTLISLHPAVAKLLKDTAEVQPNEVLCQKLNEFKLAGTVSREIILTVLDHKCDMAKINY